VSVSGIDRGLGRCAAALRQVGGWSRAADFLLNAAMRDEAIVFHLWAIPGSSRSTECDALLRSLGLLACQPRTNGELR